MTICAILTGPPLADKLPNLAQLLGEVERPPRRARQRMQVATTDEEGQPLSDDQIAILRRHGLWLLLCWGQHPIDLNAMGAL